MAYVTREEFFDSALPESFWEGASNDVIDDALARASSLVDSYLRKRYSLPLASFGPDIREAVCALAARTILIYRGFSLESRSDVAIIDRAKEAMVWLRDVSKGLCEIEGTDATPDLDENGPVVSESTGTRSRLWTRTPC